jgi:uncharacterized protein (TIGR03435 family)
MSRTVIEAELPEESYELVFATAGKDELLFPLMRQAIEASFDIEGRIEQRELDVYLLSQAAGVTPKLTPTTLDIAHPYAKPGSVTCLSTSLMQFAETMEQILQKPVLDTTGIEGLYEIDLSWDPEQPDSLAAAVMEQLGLELKADRQTIGILVIRSTS